jgi:hypothetical protein
MTAESRDQEPLDDHRAPERTPDQRMDALRKANEVRARRAQLKRDLKSGRVSLAALMVDPPPYLETAKVLEMLLALPGHGRVKATKLLNSCRVSPSKTFGGLSERQRKELTVRLDR